MNFCFGHALKQNFQWSASLSDVLSRKDMIYLISSPNVNLFQNNYFLLTKIKEMESLTFVIEMTFHFQI
jgi:hypothetical protein